MNVLKIRKVNLLIFFVCVILCLINRKLNCYSSGYLHWFLTCYFNDIVGAIAFTSYCDIITYNAKDTKYRLDTLWKIELLLLFCGLFWEFITPLYRKDTVGDIFDIFAYCFGGVLFMLLKNISKHNRKKIQTEKIDSVS